ncbi:MAG: dolichyl-phosphate-mannose--protein mannosyltransferase, partial [Sciscionella sp.]
WRNDLLPALWALAAIPVLAYLATWWSWFASETGIERHAAGGYAYKGVGIGAHSTFWFLPDALRSLWYYSGNVLSFHEHLVTTPQNHNPWESKPWTWPMGLRPMLYYYQSGAAAAGCGEANCVSATMLIGTPAMWWLAYPMLAWSGWRTIGRLDWRYATVLLVYLAGYLPWFLNLDRQMYFFYMTPVAPFLILGLVLMLGEVLGKPTAGYERRRLGALAVALYVGLVVANFVWLWPILNGDSITAWQWNAELWLPSWR